MTAILQYAFALQPDVIFLLTDGEFTSDTPERFVQLNTAGKVRVNTIAFINPTEQQMLVKLAATQNGAYRYVSEQELTLRKVEGTK